MVSNVTQKTENSLGLFIMTMAIEMRGHLIPGAALLFVFSEVCLFFF